MIYVQSLAKFGIISDLQKIVADYYLPEIGYLLRFQNYNGGGHTVDTSSLTLDKVVEIAMTTSQQWHFINQQCIIAEYPIDPVATADLSHLNLKTVYLINGLFYLQKSTIPLIWEEYHGFDHSQVYQYYWKQQCQTLTDQLRVKLQT